MALIPVTFDQACRFWEKVVITDDCWTWTAFKDRHGYGRVSLVTPAGKITRFAHRIAYQEVRHELPDDELDHLCRNTSCVRPAHLEPVSHSENVRRGRSGAHWRAKTHCPAGHAYTPENTYRLPSRPNARYCRACRRTSNPVGAL